MLKWYLLFVLFLFVVPTTAQTEDRRTYEFGLHTETADQQKFNCEGDCHGFYALYGVFEIEYELVYLTPTFVWNLTMVDIDDERVNVIIEFGIIGVSYFRLYDYELRAMFFRSTDTDRNIEVLGDDDKFLDIGKRYSDGETYIVEYEAQYDTSFKKSEFGKFLISVGIIFVLVLLYGGFTIISKRVNHLIFCPACGTKNIPDSIFCIECGSSL